jgi:uncharacterized membrane protein
MRKLRPHRYSHFVRHVSLGLYTPSACGGHNRAIPFLLENAMPSAAHKPAKHAPLASPGDSATEAAAKIDRAQLALLRAHRRAHRHRADTALPKLVAQHLEAPPLTRGQRLADGVASTIGSWRFILIQSTAIVLWITGNVLVGANSWDPYPFILLNLLLSFQAAYTAPAIMMSQNRQSELDRRHAQSDYEINVKAELEIELLHEKIDILKEQELLALTEAVRQLSAQLESLSKRLP